MAAAGGKWTKSGRFQTAAETATRARIDALKVSRPVPRLEPASFSAPASGGPLNYNFARQQAEARLARYRSAG